MADTSLLVPRSALERGFREAPHCDERARAGLSSPFPKVRSDGHVLRCGGGLAPSPIVRQDHLLELEFLLVGGVLQQGKQDLYLQAVGGRRPLHGKTDREIGTLPKRGRSGRTSGRGPMSVHVLYKGRLGNQLFQYVSARLFAARNGLCLATPFPHQEFVRMTPHDGDPMGDPDFETKIGDEEDPFGRAWSPRGRYIFDGYFQNSEWYHASRAEI